MILNKHNILTYLAIFRQAKPKSEIFKYILKRIKGQKAKFDRDVFVNGLNCGRLMENCTIACSVFEKELEDEFKNLPEGTLLDIGANIGKHSVIMAKYNPQSIIRAFEPDEDSYDLLVYNLFTFENTRHYKFGVSDNNKTETYYRNEYHPACNSTISKNGKPTTIKVMALDDFIDYDERVVLIKVDIEGAELKALKGAIKTITKWKPKIIFEAWDEHKLKEVSDFLESLGYNSISRIDEYNYKAVQR